ncbi:unnamed protein product, partial [Ectocarpus sp. 13 AM-2016]
MHPMQKHGCVRRGGTNPVCEDLIVCIISRSIGEALENPMTGTRSAGGEGAGCWVMFAISPHRCTYMCGPNRHVYLVSGLFVPPRDTTISPPAVRYFYLVQQQPFPTVVSTTSPPSRTSGEYTLLQLLAADPGTLADSTQNAASS